MCSCEIMDIFIFEQFSQWYFGCSSSSVFDQRGNVLFWHSPLSPWNIPHYYVATAFNCLGWWCRNSSVNIPIIGSPSPSLWAWGRRIGEQLLCSKTRVFICFAKWLCWKRQEQTLHTNILKFPGILFHATAIVGTCLPSKVRQVIIWSNGHIIVVASFPICNTVILWPATWLPPCYTEPLASFRFCYCTMGPWSLVQGIFLSRIKTKCTLVSLSWRDLLRIWISYRIKGRIKEKDARLSS